MGIPIKLEVFEGPLDLLMHLIEKNKIDIYDIPIVEITDQYMEYIHAMEREDLGIMSEFMVMAATLLDIKCRMLLPKEVNEDGEEEDPRAELVEKLLEYKMYKFMSYELKDKMDEAANSFFKGPTIPKEVAVYREPVDTSQLLAGLTLEKLNAIYKSIIRRQENKLDPIRSKFGTIEKEEVIVTFLSVLELMKMGHIQVEQKELFDDISIEVKTDPDTWKNLTEFAEEAEEG